MASRIEGNRESSPISSAQVSAVIGPTPGTVLRRLIRLASKGSRWRELTKAYSVFCNRTMESSEDPDAGSLTGFSGTHWERIFDFPILKATSRNQPCNLIFIRSRRLSGVL